MSVQTFRNFNELLMHNFTHHRSVAALEYSNGERAETYTYRELSHRAYTVVNYLMADKISRDEKAVIWMPNCPEAIYVDLGFVLTGGIVTPLAPETSAADVAWVINDLQAKYVFVDTKAQLEALAALRNKIPSVKKVIVREEIELENEWMVPFYWMVNFPTQIVTLGEVHKIREELHADSICNILYDTKADKLVRKGIVVSHGNLLSAAQNVGSRLEWDAETERKVQRYPNAQSIATIPERLIGYWALLYHGKTMVISEPADGRSLAAHIEETEADFVVLSADKLEFLRETISGTLLDGNWGKWALSNGLKVSERSLSGVPIPWLMRRWHKLYAKQRVRTRKKYFKNIHYVIVTDGALQEATARFFHALDCVVLQSFGTTETLGFATLDSPADPFPLGNGQAINGVEVRTERYGVVAVSGVSVFKTYWKQVRQTADAFTADGFFITDAKGHIDTQKRLVVSPVSGANVKVEMNVDINVETNIETPISAPIVTENKESETTETT